MKTNFIFAVYMLVISTSSFANEGVHTRIHNQYQSLRALGMGNAYTAVASDYAGLMYNPASLARRDSGQINMSLQAGFSTKFMDFSQDADKASKDADAAATDTDKFNIYSDFLTKYLGESFMLRMNLFEGFWVRPNWGVAVIPLDFTLEYKIHNQLAPALNTRAIVDTTIAYGYGKDLKGLVPGRLSWGVTGKFINRGYANKQIGALDLASGAEVFRDEDLRDGYTVDADLGLLYTPEISSTGLLAPLSLAKPTFSLVLRNVLDMGFEQSFNLFNETEVEAPEKLHRTLDVGSKFEFPSLWIFGGRFAFDVKNIMHPNFSMRRGLHAGAEFDWTVSSWWKGHYRAGLNQGYPTLGVSALLFVFNLDLAMYGEDVGTFNNPQQNRVVAFKASMDF